MKLECWADDRQPHVQDLLLPWGGMSSRQTLQFPSTQWFKSRWPQEHKWVLFHRDLKGAPNWMIPQAMAFLSVFLCIALSIYLCHPSIMYLSMSF